MRAYMCIYEYLRLNYQLDALGALLFGAPGALLVGTPDALSVGTPVPYTCDKCNTYTRANAAKAADCEEQMLLEAIVRNEN